MDRNRFDILARLLGTTGSRRATLGAILGVSLLGHDPNTLAKGRKEKDEGDDSRGVQGEGRPGAAHTGHHKRKQTQRQRRQKRRRNDNAGKPRENGVCCGATTSCAPPEPGSTRSQCNFVGQSFAGQDLNGATFRQIDGAGANFDDTDNHGSDFAAACLRRATFRGANLAGATWEGTCLFAADFTGADLGRGADALDAAVLCATVMPDGTRNDRDCDRSRSSPCCLPPPGGGGVGCGGQTCGPCTAADQCHLAGTCVCTTPIAPNGTSCTDGNSLCVAGVCCTDGHEAVNGGCFKIGGRGCTGCNRGTCDGCYGNVDGSAVDGRNNFLCGVRTGPDCSSNEGCPVGHACFLGDVLGGCIAPC